MDVIQTDAGALQILEDALSSTPTLKVHLFDNNLAAFNDATVLGDLNEASFSGYAAVTPTWSAPAIVGVPTTSGSSASFVYSGGSSTTVYGFYLTDSSGAKFYGGNKFPSPVVLDTVNTTVSVQIDYTQKSEH